MLKVIIPDSKTKIQHQIKALEYQLTRDTSNKNKQIHSLALEQLKKALNK